MAGTDQRIQPEFLTYQGRGLPGYDARPVQPSVVERGRAGEAMRPGYGVKFDYSDQKWYLPNDSDGPLTTVSALLAANLPDSPDLGDYLLLDTAEDNAVDNRLYDTNGTTALNGAIAADTEFRYVAQAANTNRWVKVSNESSVGADGQKAVSRYSDRANVEGICLLPPERCPEDGGDLSPRLQLAPITSSTPRTPGLTSCNCSAVASALPARP